ncbi:MAG: hemolysin family protein [Deltaproteobacteria bacterium]|jgi:CBS domain containing-hemolysin-like protein|nr:hemolysin family protein [Deltaproteobacteria bacterium]
MHIALTLLAAVALVLLNAMFVAAEFAFVRVRETKLELLAQKGSARARWALFGQKHLEDYLSVCQLGITLSSLGLGWLGEPAVASLLRPLFNTLGITNPAFIHSLSVIVGFVIITFVHVTFGELAPKNISIRAAEATALNLAIPMRIAHILFRPFVRVLNFSAQIVMYLLRADRWNSQEAHSTEELKLLIAESRDEGQLDAEEERLLTNIFNMDLRTARDIMVHRIKVVSISVDSTPDEAAQVALNCGYTRLPVYEGDKDNIIGFFHAKDLLRHEALDNIRPLVRPALYIYERMPTDRILELMRSKNTRLGLVWDEYGSFLGLITMEDVLEAIVGEILDEFDSEEPPIVPEQGGYFKVITTVSLDELARTISLQISPGDEEQYRTLAALLAGKFSENPRPGETWEGFGAEFTVLSTAGHTVQVVRVKSLPKPSTPKASQGA